MPNPLNDDPADHTPACIQCGSQVGLHTDAFIALRGMWVWSEEHDVEIFILDPDTQLAIIELPDGQLALSTDRGKITQHVDADCFEFVFDEKDENDNDAERQFHLIAGGYVR